MTKRNGTKIILAIGIAATAASGCSTFQSVFGGNDPANANQPPIRDPFNNYGPGSANASGAGQPTILRSKKGDRSVELELPQDPNDQSDLVVPLSAAFKNDPTNRSLASDGTATGANGIDDTYANHHPTMSDREITGSFPQTTFDDRGRRADIEQGLGVVPADDPVPHADESYLAGVDRIKQLYRLGRYEAALIEADAMIRQYQTDPHLYEMRGTLLDRIGKRTLAIRSWDQALRFDPGNARLKRFLERKRRIATEAQSGDAASAQGGTREPAAAGGDKPTGVEKTNDTPLNTGAAPSTGASPSEGGAKQ